MKLRVIYLFVFSFAFLGLGWIIRTAPHPEKAILGTWKEIEWEYERVYKKNMQAEVTASREHFRKYSGLVPMLHEAEVWTFLPGNTLVLAAHDKAEKYAKWSIKGRGNVLEIKYEDGVIEHYDISSLVDKKMVLNFDLDTQIKGIARLTFKKTD